MGSRPIGCVCNLPIKKKENKEGKERKKENLRGLYAQGKALDGYFVTIKLCVTMNPLKGTNNRINPRVT